MPYENIILEIQDAIAILKINRPKALNALNSATLDDLSAATLKLPARRDQGRDRHGGRTRPLWRARTYRRCSP